MSSYKDLLVWQKSIDLCQKIYSITNSFPKHEIYGLTSQIRRCTVSIPSNIAEGQRRGHTAEYVQFLRVSYSSAAELETQLIIAHRIKYLSSEDFELINVELQQILKMLNKLIIVLQPQTKT